MENSVSTYDIEDGINVDAMDTIRSAFGRKIYCVTGNHEYMNSIVRDGKKDTTVNVTGGTIWMYLDQLMTDCVVGNAERNYYYVDNTVQKMRYIILNDFKDGPANDWESEQKNWLQTVLSTMESGYTAIIFMHAVAGVNHTTGALTNLYYWNDLQTIVDGYSGDGEIACIIGGHTHFDGLGATSGGIPVFITACDKAKPFTGDDDWLEDQRTVGTITEQAFDVFVVDKKNKKISAIRIGCPADNPAGTPLEIRTAYYAMSQ